MDQECLIRPCFDIHTGLCLTRQCQLSRGRVDADATGEATFLLVLLAQYYVLVVFAFRHVIDSW